MVMVEKKNDIEQNSILESQSQQLQQQQQQQQQHTVALSQTNCTIKRDSYEKIVNTQSSLPHTTTTDDEIDDDEYEDEEQHQNNKRIRSIENNNKELSMNRVVGSKYGKIDELQKKDEHENLLFHKKSFTKATYNEEMYAPISPALTNNSDKSPMHHHELMLQMHQFNEDHGLSSSALSSSSSSLIRTSSNASSSSSSSSNTNNNNNNGEIAAAQQQQQQDNPGFLIPTANQLLMLNENLKKYISSSAPTSSNGPDNSFLSDQLALMVRSRSSSSESSASSSSATNSCYQMKNLIQMHSNLRGSDIDNVLLSKYLNSVTRAYQTKQQQQQNFLFNNPGQEALMNELLLKQAAQMSQQQQQPHKLSKIDETDNNATKPIPIPTTAVMKQMLNNFNTNNSYPVNLQQQQKKIDQQDQDLQINPKISQEKNEIQNELDLKNEEIKAKLSAVVNKVPNSGSNSTVQGSSSLCKVCGDEASGFHYGVDSCEGCKGFFRRCITQGMNHQCTNNQQCEITPFSRNSCQFCRLKKCFGVGMSREASRLGRRPKRPREEGNANQSWSKNEDEISDKPANERFEPNEAVAEAQFMNQQQQKPPKKESNVNDSPKLSKSKFKENQIKTTTTTANSLMDLSSISTSLNSIPQPPFNLDHKVSNERMIAHHEDDLTDDEHQQEVHASTKISNQPINISTLLSLIEVADEYLSFERVTQLEYIRCAIIEAHCLLWPTTQDRIQSKLRESCPVLKPKTPHLVKESSLWEDSIEAIVPLIMDVVKCTKYIPGFSELTQHDQVQLLKQGAFEAICVNSFNLVDIERKLMLTPDLKYYMDSSDIKLMPLGFFMSDIFELSFKASSLKLNDEEVALFNALLIINPNREGLVNRKKVQEFQATLLHVLYRHMKKFRPDDDEIFQQLLKLIPIIANLNQKHSETINKLQTSTPKSEQQTAAAANQQQQQTE